MRGIREFEEEVFEAIRTRKYVELPPVMWERGVATIKLRFRIRGVRGGFLQFYYNQETGKVSLAFVIGNNRVYGHDYIPAYGWHRHLFPSGNHDYSENGRRSVTVDEFMKGVDEILRDMMDKG